MATFGRACRTRRRHRLPVHAVSHALHNVSPPVSQGGGTGGLFDVCLTTYTLWEREGPTYGIDRCFLAKWPWSHVVMDEAHALKNSASTRSRKLRKVAQLAATRIMLTGERRKFCGSCTLIWLQWGALGPVLFMPFSRLEAAQGGTAGGTAHHAHR